MPDGHTTYAANAIERVHRTLKDVMPSTYPSQGVGDLIVEVCTTVNARIRRGYYRDVTSKIAEPPAFLKQARTKRTSGPEGDDGTQTKWLDRTSIWMHC